MAEYFPLLDRAVSGLTEPTVEARRSIYERARAALIGQLRRMDPPVPEEDIARESTALDEAIARVEAGFAERQPAVPAAPPAAPAAPPRILPPPLPTGTAAPVVPPPSRERPVMGTRPAPAIDRPLPPAGGAGRPTVRVAPPPRGTRPVMALRPAVPPPDATPAGKDGAEAVPEDRPSRAQEPGGASFETALDDVAREDGGLPPLASRGGDPSSRPPAPRPPAARRPGWQAAALGLVALVLVTAIAIAAYKLRDRPEQVVATRATAVTVEGATPGKVVERASPAASGDAEATSGGATGAAVPAPVPQGLDAGSPGPSIAVAQRAALLVDAPEDPQRVKTYVGTVVWHLDSVSPGGGQPLATAVKADIDIPDAKLKVTMLMQRNPEPQLPASHTIEFHFLPQPGNTLGGVKQVNVPEMRKDDDAQTGDALTGVPVAITDNYFLVGLSRGGGESQNMRLVADRNWFDMSLLFVSGKLGKLTFEKGASGQRTFEDALKAWK